MGQHPATDLHALPTQRKGNRYSGAMTQKMTIGTAALLVTAPLMWAGNAVVGRMVNEMLPPMTLNFLRWLLAGLLLLKPTGCELQTKLICAVATSTASLKFSCTV